jgi:hypothetical protein
MKIILFLITFCICPLISIAQITDSNQITESNQLIDSDATENNEGFGKRIGDSKFFFNYNFITPNGLLYFDLGEDLELNADGEPVEPDFYKDGNANFNLQVASFDLLYGEGVIKGGMNFGLGVSTSQGSTNEAGYFIMNGGFAITFNENLRIETGLILGLSAKESYDNFHDSAFYIGVSFPTKLSEAIKGAISD